MKCAICGIRKPRRFCPGVRADICTICCGTEREQTVDCPLECEYLHEAHEHERVPEVDFSQVPNNDFRITEDFLKENEMPLFFLGAAAFEGAIQSRSATDYDAREALEALVRSYKALDTGLVYETKPVNPYAAAIYEMVQSRVAEVRKLEAEGQPGAFRLRDSIVLGVLVFLQRLEFTNNNGRKRSRAFLDVLRKFYADQVKQVADSPEPDAPLIIL